MEYVFKSAVAAVAAAILSLVIKKNNPELAMLLGLIAAVLAVYFALDAVRPVLDMMEELKNTASLAGDIYLPVLKCLGIGIITQIGSGLCKDAGQTAAGTGVELCGTVAAILCTLPLIRSILSIIEELS